MVVDNPVAIIIDFIADLIITGRALNAEPIWFAAPNMGGRAGVACHTLSAHRVKTFIDLAVTVIISRVSAQLRQQDARGFGWTADQAGTGGVQKVQNGRITRLQPYRLGPEFE